jgi:hypothetical protein
VKPVSAVVRYRYGDRGGGEAGRGASFYGSFYDRSEAAVLSRLREVHRLAAWIEIVDLEWRDAREVDAPGTGAGRDD